MRLPAPFDWRVSDELVNQLLYLDGEEESAIALLALADLFEVDQNLPTACSALPSPVHSDILTVPDGCLLYTSPSPRDGLLSRMPSSA